MVAVEVISLRHAARLSSFFFVLFNQKYKDTVPGLSLITEHD